MMHLTVTGNLGSNAETRDVGGDAVTQFSVASTKKEKSGETTTWVRCSLWGKRGPALAQYLVKGAQVTVVGEMTEREYEKNGEKRKSLEVRVSDIALQGGKRDENGASKPKPQASADDDPEWMHE